MFVPLPDIGRPDITAIASHPLLQRIAVPVEPLVATFVAEDTREALLRGLPCLAAVLVLFELVRRWPADWREVAIATSSRVGKRLDRARRLGTGASSTAISKWAARRSVPWLLGRSPTGAVFWRKSASIFRRARITLVVAGLTLLVGVGGLRLYARDFEGDPGWAVGLLVVFGSIYLSGTLRFDLREEVDRLEQIKSWPLRSSRLFLALLLPQVAVVGTFISIGAALFAILMGTLSPSLLLALAFLPVFLLGWVATDNVFFLLWPVRVVPGADGVLQDVGRASVLFLCRAVLVGLALALSIGAAYVAWSLQAPDTDTFRRAAVAAPAAWFVLLLWAVLAVRSGGKALVRFDPSRLDV
ncbi:MAG: hypothetical protein R3F34_01760 [Planctomycetota bacterium]